MGKGNDRNVLCFCGSGIKYKNCHAKREFQKKVELHEMNKDFMASHTRKKCMAPETFKNECTKSIIKAHTISKSSNLKQISKDGHVMHFKINIMDLDRNNGKFPIEKVGINKASVINAFCSKHDKELFSVIEDKEFIFTDEQVFMLAYRAISRELYLKYSSRESNKNMKEYDKGQVKEMQLLIQMFTNSMTANTHLAVRDLENIKIFYDKKLVEENFSSIKYYCILIDSVPEIMSAAGWLPELDFNNNKLLDLNDKNTMFNTLTVSTIGLKGGKGAVIFAWLDVIDSKACISFIKSLNEIPDDYKDSAILKWLFECNENIYWSEDWWNTIELDKQNELINSMMNHMRGASLKDYKSFSSCLSWKINEIKTNINL
ncbi:SEC-C domain-containing protein [Aliarcobacter cryaerophilus]|uniref:SEC-C domain-containing protein n=1 Tax=Aliarcobacter cryaerophilus TaxID=28198 RepID=UPI00112F0D0C|nr:SEC-C domain-containing protein [Aliarcobacter cryaerophilus]